MNKVEKKKNVSTLAGWQKKKDSIVEVELPSGAFIKMRNLNLIEQAQTGNINTPLLVGSLGVAEKMSDASKLKDLKDEDLNTMIEVLDRTAILAVVEPKLDENSVKNIPMNDKLFIFGFISAGGGMNLRPFRR